MHPVVGAGLADYSNFMPDPWGRGTRTRESMITSVYGGEAAIVETASVPLNFRCSLRSRAPPPDEYRPARSRYATP
jgi:uncharacterized protein (DUF2236 family)